MATMKNNNVNAISSQWFNVETVPQTHTFPTEIRPGNDPIPTCKKIPIIDMAGEYTYTVHKIFEASRDYGVFLVTNHGVSEDVVEETANVLEELFNLPPEELGKDAKDSGWAYMGSRDFAANGAYLWRDNLKHPCHPLEDCLQHWPRTPIRYRDVTAAYVMGIRSLSLRILEMISRGLGIEKGYLGRMSQVQFLSASRYPACPDPALTIGVHKHYDHNLVTILYQGNVQGLQILRDSKWLGVEAVPNSFVVNIGTQLQVISNGKLKSVEHRAVTNPHRTRISIATFVNPNPDSIIEPAKELVDQQNPALYPSMSFKEFVDASKPFGLHTDVVQNGMHSNSKIN